MPNFPDKFTIEEINIICMYHSDDKIKTIAEITRSLPYIDDPEMVGIMRSVVKKLERISDGEYAATGFFSV